MPRTVMVNSGNARYAQNISVGPHLLQADEPRDFGGNDVGSVMLEENVVRAAGTSNCTTEEELRRVIRDAGFRPAQRDTLYTTFFLN